MKSTILHFHSNSILIQDSINDLQQQSNLSGLPMFKEAYGKTMHQYFLDKRFEVAKILLAKGFLVQEVSQRVGYSDIASFSNAFKKRTGLTPIEFKAQKHNGSNIHKKS